MASASFNDAMEWVGALPPWNDGVPCELLFDREVVTEVWAGDNRAS